MAEKLDAKTVLKDLVLVQNGKVVAGEPARDNYAVYAKPGSALGAIPATEIVKVLKAAYPLATFTFCAKPPSEKAPEKK
jgi:hypothetical protein